MPIQTRPAPVPIPSVHTNKGPNESYGSHHDSHHSHSPSSWNGQHRDALRIALGSILSPKRPSFSRTSSGTASPAFSFTSSSSGYASPAMSSSSPVIPPAPATSPTHEFSEQTQSTHFIHPHHHPHPHHHQHQHHQHHLHHHPHTPSRLGMPDADAHSQSYSSQTDSHSHPSSLAPSTDHSEAVSPMMSRSSSMGSTHSDAELGHETPSTVPISASAPASTTVIAAPVPMSVAPGMEESNGAGKGKFIKALQGKSAWDALIHGSFT